jgi:lipoprotein-releasing system permease protein
VLNKFTTIVALRYFGAKKHERFVSIISGISLVGITIGVAALIIVMSVMNGFHAELTGNIIGLNGDITITPMTKTIQDYNQVLNKLSKHSYIKKVTPVVIGQALALAANSNSGVLIKGINLRDLKNKGEILGNVVDGSFTDYDDNNIVAVGSELARNLGLYAGSKIKMISPNLISTAFGSMPRSKDFIVIAIFNSGLYEYDMGTMLMPVSAAQKFLATSGGINLIELNIDDAETATSRARELQNELGFSVKVTSWKELNKQFLTALEVERVAMFTILSLIMVVAAFNIVSSLFMMVKDKTKDIAILRTIGASKKQIMTIFILNGMITGLIGTFIGLMLGLVISFNIENIRKFLENFSGIKIFDPAIYFLYSLPSVVKLPDVIMVSSLAIILCFLATLYPSYKAAKLNPVEAMRYE